MGYLSPYYDSSFDGTSFWKLDGSPSKPDTISSGTTYHVPGTNNDVDIRMGLAGEPFEVAIGVETAELTALEGKAETSGTLNLGGVSTSSVKLLAVINKEKAGSYDAYHATLRLLK